MDGVVLGDFFMQSLGESVILKCLLATPLSWLVLLLWHVGGLVIPSSDVPQDILGGPL